MLNMGLQWEGKKVFTFHLTEVHCPEERDLCYPNISLQIMVPLL